MPLITLGDDTELKLQIPSKGDTNWSEDIKTYCFQKIVDHDHTGSSGKGINRCFYISLSQGMLLHEGVFKKPLTMNDASQKVQKDIWKFFEQ